MTKNDTELFEEARVAILKTPFGDHPALFFDPRIEGYRNYVFGMRAGPVSELSNLAHELAHAAEFGVDLFQYRCYQGQFSFRIKPLKSMYAAGRYHHYRDDPRSMQSTFRELRTAAIQMHVLEMMGDTPGEEWAFDFARAMDFMPDWFHVPGEDAAERRVFCSELIQLLYHDFDKPSIVRELVGWLDKTQKKVGKNPGRPSIKTGFIHEYRPY